jgi:hypothetical protein
MIHSLRGAALALLVFVAILGFGCSSGSSTSSTTFTEVYTTVLAKNCTNATCHFSGSGSLLGALDMSSQPAAYMNLVNVKAAGIKCGTSGLTRVVPSDPNSSLMYEKVHDAVPPCGAQMPYGLPALVADEQALIFDWINAGAQNN